MPAATSWVSTGRAVLAMAVVAAGLSVPTATASPNEIDDGAGIVRASVPAEGGTPNAGSDRLSLSRDGRYVVFTSHATNLVRGGTKPGVAHVYLRDLRLRTTTLVDVADNGAEANANAWGGTISADGRRISFLSDATNLQRTATPAAHVYLRDLGRRTTTLVDVSDDGRAGDRDAIQPQISPDGGAVVFMSLATDLAPGGGAGAWNVFLRDLDRHGTKLVNVGLNSAPANGLSYGPSVDSSHRYVAFASLASNLVPGDTNNAGDVFVRDLATGKTTMVSVGNGDVEGDDLAVGSSISADGRYVGFSSHATNIAPGLSTDHSSHAYVRDLKTSITTLIDVAPDGTVANAGSTWTGVSTDGRYALFLSSGTNLVPGKTNKTWDVFRRDLRTGQTILVSSGVTTPQTNGENWWPAMSANDRVVGFLSFASDLPGAVAGTSQVYVRFL